MNKHWLFESVSNKIKLSADKKSVSSHLEKCQQFRANQNNKSYYKIILLTLLSAYTLLTLYKSGEVSARSSTEIILYRFADTFTLSFSFIYIKYKIFKIKGKRGICKGVYRCIYRGYREIGQTKCQSVSNED